VSALTDPVAARTSISVKAQHLAVAVAHLATAAQLQNIALSASRQRSLHAFLLTFHRMICVVAQRSISVKVPAMAIVAVFPGAVGSP
jgi:hypothetical protein